MATPWTSSDPSWRSLSPYQRAAAMALMEADGMDSVSAKNALAAMLNRSQKEGVNLGEHVSKPIYQPTIEPSQRARLPRILNSKAYPELTSWAERRAQGLEPDIVNGATHFLAPERTMLSLEAGNPSKYRSWRKWTGFDPKTQAYNGVIMRDSSHAFLAPEGAFSAPQPQTQVASQAASSAAGVASPAMITNYGREGHPGGPPAQATAVASSSPTPTSPGDVASAGTPGAFTQSLLKDGMGALGAFGKSMGAQDDGAGQQLAQLQGSAAQANAQALSEDEQRRRGAFEYLNQLKSRQGQSYGNV